MNSIGRSKPWQPRTVGIALAAFRPNPEWLSEQLASIVAQTHTEWFCVITLDSPMGDILDQRSLAPFIHDERFLWVENERQLGVRSNFEKATNLVLQRMPDLIAFSDQDDIWLPNKLEESTIAISESGPRTMVYCDAFLLVEGVVRAERLHDCAMKTKGKMSITERIIQPHVSGFCAVFDASLAQLHPIIPVELPHHDHWYSLVAAAYGGVHRIDKPLALYRQHAGNTIGISIVRAQQGWDKTEPLKRYSTLRENAHLRANIARRAGKELPMSRGLALFYQHSAGWLLVLLGVMGRRLVSDQFLAANAYRKAWGLILLESSQREFVQQVRKRLPKQIKVVRTALAAGALLLAASALAATQLQDISVAVIATFVLVCLLAVSLVVTGLRYLQHQMPHTPVLLVGLGALSGLLAQLFGANVWSTIAIAAVPVAANVLYRLRWMKRT